MVADAGKALGCAVWMKRNGSVGTDYANHGFDLVIGSSGESNKVDSLGEEASCCAQVYGNYIVTMDGWQWNFPPWWGVSYDEGQMQRAFLHEVFHTYDAEDIQDTGWIMHDIVLGNWKLNSATKTTVSNHDTHFDGPP